MVEDAHTSRVLIKNVPVGQHKVQVMGSARGRKDVVEHNTLVEVRPNEISVLTVSVPGYSTGYYFLAIAVFVVLTVLTPSP